MKRLIEGIKNRRIIIILWVVLISIFIVGGVYSNKMIELRPTDVQEDAQRYYDAVELIDLEYNFDPETFGASPYITTFTYEGVTYRTYVDITFCFEAMYEGNMDSIDLIVMAAVKHHAEEAALLQNTAQLISYDSTTRTVVMEARGFISTIYTNIVLNSTLDGIESFSINSQENYDNEYNIDYAGASVPSVEFKFLDEYMQNDIVPGFDTVAGASEGTGMAMEELITLLDLFIDSLEGGN